MYEFLWKSSKISYIQIFFWIIFLFTPILLHFLGKDDWCGVLSPTEMLLQSNQCYCSAGVCSQIHQYLCAMQMYLVVMWIYSVLKNIHRRDIALTSHVTEINWYTSVDEHMYALMAHCAACQTIQTMSMGQLWAYKPSLHLGNVTVFFPLPWRSSDNMIH